MEIWFAALMGTLAGVLGTGAGGVLSFALPRLNKRLIAALLSFTGGLMLAVVCFDLLPEAFALHSIATGLLGLALGVAFVIVLDALVSGMGAAFGPAKVGLLMTLGIAIHNFPEGLAIGSGYAAAPALGMELCLLIALHDLPEGLAMGIPLRRGGMGLVRVACYAALSGVPTSVGAWLGYWAGSLSPAMISLSMGVAGGAMLYLTVSELLPQAGDLHRGRLSGVALCAGVAVGIIAAAFLEPV